MSEVIFFPIPISAYYRRLAFQIFSLTALQHPNTSAFDF
jgi:hypothetical protein